MAVSCSSIHVHFGADPPSDAQQQVADAVKATLADGWVEVGSDEWPDREVIVTRPEGGWVSVLDQETRKDERGLVLARGLSWSILAPVFGFWMFDQDEIEILLFQGGAVLDRTTLGCEGLTDETGSDLGAWRGLVAPGHTVGDLVEHFSGGWVNLLDVMYRIADAVGVPHASITGWRTSRSAEGGLVLRFRSRLLPPKPMRRVGGPPSLAYRGRDSSDTYVRNGGLDRVDPHPRLNPGVLVAGIRSQSQGSATRGVVVEVGGSAIDEGLIDPVEAYVGAGRSGFSGTRHRFSPKGPDGWASAAFPEIEIGPALEVTHGFVTPPRPANIPAHISEAIWRGMLMTRAEEDLESMLSFIQGVRLEVAARVLRAGEGILSIRVYPVENPGGGIIHHFPLRIDEINPETVWDMVNWHSVEWLVEGSEGVVVPLPSGITEEVERLLVAITNRDGEQFIEYRRRLVERGTPPELDDEATVAFNDLRNGAYRLL